MVRKQYFSLKLKFLGALISIFWVSSYCFDSIFLMVTNRALNFMPDTVKELQEEIIIDEKSYSMKAFTVLMVFAHSSNPSEQKKRKL